jgi:large subunit ribosomal protein L22
MVADFKVLLKGVRISPRKARLVVDLVRGKHVQEALELLKFTRKRTAPVLAKMISSGIANARNTSTVDVDNLVVAEVMVDEGPTIKRFLPRAQGRATPIRKRTSHISVQLREI